MFWRIWHRFIEWATRPRLTKAEEQSVRERIYREIGDG